MSSRNTYEIYELIRIRVSFVSETNNDGTGNANENL